MSLKPRTIAIECFEREREKGDRGKEREGVDLVDGARGNGSKE